MSRFYIAKIRAPDGSLYLNDFVGGYIDFDASEQKPPGDPKTIRLEGIFTAEELRLLAAHMDSVPN